MKLTTTLRRFLASLFRSSPKVEVHGGTSCSVEGLEYRSLYRCLGRLPGVTFARKPRYFWTGSGVYAEFVFRGHAFLIESDSFDGALWICSKDELAHADEIRDIGEHIETFACGA
ncbi:hypothetical protein [Prosthecobacter sp.]